MDSRERYLLAQRHALPGARLFSYGYPYGIFAIKSVAGLRDFTKHLLDDVGMQRIARCCQEASLASMARRGASRLQAYVFPGYWGIRKSQLDHRSDKAENDSKVSDEMRPKDNNPADPAVHEPIM